MSTADPLPRSTPSALGIDAQGIRDFLDAQNAAGLDVHSLIVVRDGQVACAGWASPYDADSTQLVYSLSKTFTSAAAGVAVAEGLFGYDDLLVDHFPDLAEGASDAARTIRVRDALAMATGHTRDMHPGEDVLCRASVRDLFVPGPDGTPGETFAYNQMAPYAVARIIEQTSGTDLLDYLNQRILHPLGRREARWRRDIEGRALGFSGLHVTTDTIASFFQLLADDGVRNGVRLLPEEWIENHRVPQVDNSGEPNPDWQQGYGWQCWMSRHGYRGDGAFGQWGLVLPEQRAVVAMTGEQADMQQLLDLVWQHLLPAFDRAGSPEADAALAEQLDQWCIEPLFGEPVMGLTLDADDGLGGHISIADSVLTWTDADGVAHVCGLGDGEWALGRWSWPDDRHLDVAVCAAVQGEEVLVRVLATNTPHCFTWTFAPSAPTRFEWRLEPLHSSDPRRLAVR